MRQLDCGRDPLGHAELQAGPSASKEKTTEASWCRSI